MSKRSKRSIARRVTVGACLLALATVAGSASGWAKDVTVIGCPQPGVEAGCLVMRVDGKLYNITAAKPKPRVGVLGLVHGTVSDEVSACMQGTVLSPATWVATPDGTCSPAAKQ